MGPAAWSILARAGGGASTGPLEGPGNTETPHPGVPGGASRQQFVRRRPTLPHRSQCSTIGAEGLSFRVRNGAGRFPFAMTAVTPGRHVSCFRKRVTTNSCQYCVVVLFPDCISGTTQWTRSIFVSSYRLISTGQLHTLLCFHIRPINPVV